VGAGGEDGVGGVGGGGDEGGGDGGRKGGRNGAGGDAGKGGGGDGGEDGGGLGCTMQSVLSKELLPLKKKFRQYCGVLPIAGVDKLIITGFISTINTTACFCCAGVKSIEVGLLLESPSIVASAIIVVPSKVKLTCESVGMNAPVVPTEIRSEVP